MVHEPLLRAAAWYYLRARSLRGTPLDSVARFHLGNGARLERLNFLADTSERALQQSHGLMVNYLYDPEHIEQNHEAYAQQHAIVAASVVTRLVRAPARGDTPVLLIRLPSRGKLPDLRAPLRAALRPDGALRPSVHRHDGAAGHAVLRRSEEQDGRRHLLDLRPGGMVGVRHRAPVGCSIHGLRRDSVDQDACRHDRLARCVKPASADLLAVGGYPASAAIPV
jgi:hypothetical protein